MVIGPIPSAGKSFVAANLATSQVEIGLRVLVIDADMPAIPAIPKQRIDSPYHERSAARSFATPSNGEDDALCK
jgi:Mrp family chromosome partitioning ATPase